MPYAGWPRRVAEASSPKRTALEFAGAGSFGSQKGAGFGFGLFGADQPPQNTHPLPNEQRMRHPTNLIRGLIELGVGAKGWPPAETVTDGAYRARLIPFL